MTKEAIAASLAGQDFVCRFVPNDSSAAGKLADVELVFHRGSLAGLKLMGFSIWERRVLEGRRHLTLPARTYRVNGEQRSFALLRPDGSGMEVLDAFSKLILEEFEKFEEEHRNEQST